MGKSTDSDKPEYLQFGIPLFAVYNADHLTKAQERLKTLDEMVCVAPKDVAVEVRMGDSEVRVTPVSGRFTDVVIPKPILSKCSSLEVRNNSLQLRVEGYTYVIEYNAKNQ